MKLTKLSNMAKGWFIGNFEPTAYKTSDVEVAIKKYSKGDCEELHYHKIATEITVIVEGKVKMNNIEYIKGDIIIIFPNESTNFEAIEDSTTVVIKHPGEQNDKYFGVSKI